jgi:hypothetical protein
MADEQVTLPEVSVTAPPSAPPASPVPSMVGAPAPAMPAPEPTPAPVKPGPDPSLPADQAGPPETQGPQPPVETQGPPLPKSTIGRVYTHSADPSMPASPVVHAVDLMKPGQWPDDHVAPAAPTSNAPWAAELQRHSLTAGVDYDMMMRIAGKESSYNPNARPGTSTASGIFQFTNPTWQDLAARYGGRLGLNDKGDSIQQARLAPYYMKEIQTHLETVLGRKPTAGESYLGWFLGPTDAGIALKAGRDHPVAGLINSGSIAANYNVFKNVSTVGDLYKWADQKMGGPGMDHPGPSIDLRPYLELGPQSSADRDASVSHLQYPLASGLANMISHMPPELRAQIKINSAFRSPETQARIMSEKIGGMLGASKRASWDADVAKMGPEAAGQKWHDELRANGITRWVGLPGGSEHQKGNAVDLNIQKAGPLQTWVHQHAAEYGLYFPMGHEPWHVQAMNPAQAKLASYGESPGYNHSSMPIPFTRQDHIDQERARQDNSYGLAKAAVMSASQDWTVANMLKDHGKEPFDPEFHVTPDMLQRDDIKALPSNYLRGIAASKSQQDFEFQAQRAKKDFDIEQKLANTPYGGGIRAMVGLADPGGIALGMLAPGGMMVRAAGKGLGMFGKMGVLAADGAAMGVAQEVPAIYNKPGYEDEAALHAGLLGTFAGIGLQRHLWGAHPAAGEINEAVDKAGVFLKRLEGGTTLDNLGSHSVGAASVAGMRDAVRDDLDGIHALETPKTAFGQARFDVMKQKNSPNELVAAVTDHFGQDTVGNLDKNIAVTRPAEYDQRELNDRALIHWSRSYNDAVADFRKRNNIGWLAWQKGGEEQFQKDITAAVRNTDPTIKFDPAHEQMAGTFREIMEHFRNNAENPGLLRGETRRPLPGAEDWKDNPNYVPRYTNWDKFNVLNGQFGSKEMTRLITNAIRAKNPDLDRDLVAEIGDAYYRRLARVEAGQEDSVQRAFSGADQMELRRILQEEGIDHDSIEKAIYHLDEKDASGDGKVMSSRQRRRTLMDENYSEMLSGRDGSRAVSVGEMWEDNSRAIIHAYSRQMSGAIAMAAVQIKNPLFKEGIDEETKRYIVDGIHSRGDWETLKAKMKARDAEVRYEDQGKTLSGELKNLQWLFDSITGTPQDVDRTKLGQALRVMHNVNFIRLMSQAGWASIAEFGNLLGNVGLKHMVTTMPSLKELFTDIYRGRLSSAEARDLEATFTAGTDHLRGTGLTWGGTDHASALNDGAGLSNKLARAEQITKKMSRYTSMVSLAPLTTFQERWALQAALAKMKGAALRGEKLNDARMRLIGLDADMQQRVLNEIKKHDGSYIIGERGNKVATLGLDKWEPQTRSAFEFAMNTWVRRIIQQNDLGQMNAFLGGPLAKILFQFRNFTIGAWSKQTLANVHMRDSNALFGFLGSMMFGSLAYAVQRYIGGAGLPDGEREKQIEKDLAWDRIVAAGFQRAGHSSLIPGAFDFGVGALGFQPVFDTRATQQPTQGLGANPTTGAVDALYSGFRGVGRALNGTDDYNSKKFRDLDRAVNLFHSWPIMTNIVNGVSGAFPEPTTSH